MKTNLKTLTLAAVIAGSALAGSSISASAQGNGRGAGKHDEHGKAKVVRKDDRSKVVQRTRAEILRDEQRRDNDRRITVLSSSKNGKGPSFCRSGAGHPVFGRAWCADKGFGIGNDRWGRAGWEDVVFGRNTSRTGSVSGGTLSDILGRVIYGRLVNQSSAYTTSPLTGRWLTSSSGPLVLQVHSGAYPVAEFVDSNRDGRADVVFVNLGR